MGYGNLQGTFNIGIVETDVQAIVDGITGNYARTLTDVDNSLGNYLSYYGNSVASMLQWVLDQMSNANSSLYNLQSYLGGYNYGTLYDGNTVVNYLSWINSNTGGLQGYLAGWNGGPLNDIAYNTSYTAGNTSYLSNIDYAISNIRDYLYDYNSYQSAASLLNDIRNILQQLSFDGSGRLRVTTTG